MKLLLWKPLFFLLLIIIFQIISFLWSTDLKLGLHNILIFLIFLIIMTSTYEIAKSYPKRILYVLIIYFIFLLIEVILVIIFRIYPLIELDFLHSNIAKIFINPNTIHGLFNGIRNNVFDPNKAGGFFVNANVAAAFLGINALICYSFFKIYNNNLLKIITFFLIIGVFFTGSKAGIILILSLLFLSFIIFYFLNKILTLQKIIYILFFINIIYLLIIFWGYNFLQSDFVKKTMSTTEIRLLIWKYGIEQFLQHPIIGLGFGGWQENFKIYALKMGIGTGFPPHNTLLYLWAQSGIFVVIFALLFIFYIIKFGLILIKSSIKELQGLGIAILGAFGWTFIHGMGTNFGLIGEIHMEIILATLLGYSLARLKFYQKKVIYENEYNNL
ncbi:conserved hypothetical protein [Lebetimonas natsushimae]|uniref:O-antigen ligase-related domain-containing protein n=1 Tax=Lebetimonas natsushimae TaxID=1936991 RepID=A0A292YBG3_9BACT|nr:O-antigen ligase family protein [Lebetimonas natsushimae]GAX86869.1 conserved hypothetical protein [Lebetimonas natsushimae]